MDKSIIRQDGSLYNLAPRYIYWSVEDNEITLDGRFSVDDLLWLVAHMTVERGGRDASDNSTEI